MNPNQIFGNDDTVLNGDILVYLQEGEIYDRNAAYMVYTVEELQGRVDIDNFNPVDVPRNVANATLLLNMHAIKTAIPNLENNLTADLCYLRFLCLKYGLMSSRFTDQVLAGSYNQVGTITVAPGDDLPVRAIRANEVLANDDNGMPANLKITYQNALVARLNAGRRTELNTCFVNIVCSLAFMFRQRGHHYLPEYLQRYNSLWNKTATHSVVNQMDWEHVVTVGLHAIPPNVLDLYWRYASVNAMCDGAFTIRLNVLAAGTAVYGAVLTGVRDLKAVFPGVLERLSEEVTHVEETHFEILRDRWAHSINAKLYNKPRDRLNEQSIGALASLIKASLDALAPDHPLREAPSLQRVANIAPITGAAYAKGIREYVNTDEFRAHLKLT